MTAQRRYLDLRFDLRYRTAKRIDVALTVGGAETGGETGDIPVPFDQKALDRAMAKLDERTISEAELLALGGSIGGMLLPEGAIRTLFSERVKPNDAYEAIRLRLIAHDPILARIPWELAYFQPHPGDPDVSNFLVLDPDVSMVRHPPLTEGHGSLGGFDPRRLRLVVATANASRMAPLDLARERAVIEAALSKVSVPGVTIEVVSFVEDATRERLIEALDNGADLFHFAGHGVFRETDVDPETKRPIGAGSIALEADGGRMELLGAANLAIRLKAASVRVAVLGACEGGRVDGVRDWTGVAPALIEKGVAAVVAMQFPVKDALAIGFSRAFYSALAKGTSIDEAVTRGRLEMHDLDPHSSQFAVPVLYMRSDDGAIFTADTAQVAEPETTVFRGARPSPWLTEIFGRDAEQQRLADLLADPGTRVVTVVGREGIGKSALVCVTMARLEAGTWSGTEPRPRVAGIIYHSVRDTAFTLDKLFDDFARVVGGDAGVALDRLWANASVPIEEKVDQFLHALAGRLNVVVLEDFETLLDENGAISDPRTRTLFERAVLSPWHTRLVLVSRVPLAFPEAARQFDVRVEMAEGLDAPDGIAMLRALDPNDAYQVRDATDAELARAVERVHGVPGALKMIFRILDEALGRSLDDALGTFYTDETVVRDLLDRGYEGLASDPDGTALRRVMQALAVFRTPVGHDALEFLLKPQDLASKVDAAVDRLARMQMVEIDRRTGLISVNAIDQDYAYGQIPPTGASGVAALERRAADWFASVRLPPAAWSTADGLDPQLREFDHRMRAGDPDGASAVLAGIEIDHLIWNGKPELASWYRAQLDGKLTDARQLALHAFAVGNIQLVLGPLDSALERLDDALARARTLPDESMEADALADSGETLRRLGRLTEAVDRLRAAIPLYQHLGDGDGESNARLCLSLTTAYLGDGPGALAEGARVMALAEKAGNPAIRARADDSLSLGYLVVGDLDKALEHAEAAIRAYGEAAMPEPVGYIVNVKGMILLAQDRAADAAAEFERADQAGAAAQQPRIRGLGLFNLARARRVLRDPAGALDAARDAEAEFRAVGASEAAAAAALWRALKASVDGDPSREVTELLACARASTISADLQPSLDLAEEAERRAAEAGPAAQALRKDARALADELRARLTKRS